MKKHRLIVQPSRIPGTPYWLVICGRCGDVTLALNLYQAEQMLHYHMGVIHDTFDEKVSRVIPEIRRIVWAEVAASMNLVANQWEVESTDPCRVRITREYANAYRAYAENLGSPPGQFKRLAIDFQAHDGEIAKLIRDL